MKFQHEFKPGKTANVCDGCGLRESDAIHATPAPIAAQTEPDVNCVTLANGDCVGNNCMHDVPAEQVDAARLEKCVDCDAASRHAYSDATTPGFFNPKCSKHQAAELRAASLKQETQPPRIIFPIVCEYCECSIQSTDDLVRNHGIGVCVKACKSCEGSGVASSSPLETPAPSNKSTWPGDYSCAVCGFGMIEPCEHWKSTLAASSPVIVRGCPYMCKRCGEPCSYQEGHKLVEGMEHLCGKHATPAPADTGAAGENEITPEIARAAINADIARRKWEAEHPPGSIVASTGDTPQPQDVPMFQFGGLLDAFDALPNDIADDVEVLRTQVNALRAWVEDYFDPERIPAVTGKTPDAATLDELIKKHAYKLASLGHSTVGGCLRAFARDVLAATLPAREAKEK